MAWAHLQGAGLLFSCFPKYDVLRSMGECSEAWGGPGKGLARASRLWLTFGGEGAEGRWGSL